jgi:hypothetical protein
MNNKIIREVTGRRILYSQENLAYPKYRADIDGLRAPFKCTLTQVVRPMRRTRMTKHAVVDRPFAILGSF